MVTEDVLQALSIELRSVIRNGWTLMTEDGTLLLEGPDTPEFVSEVWRIARFVAYDAYVCIERQGDIGKHYKVTSRSQRGLSFELMLRARER